MACAGSGLGWISHNSYLPPCVVCDEGREEGGRVGEALLFRDTLERRLVPWYSLDASGSSVCMCVCVCVCACVRACE